MYRLHFGERTTITKTKNNTKFTGISEDVVWNILDWCLWPIKFVNFDLQTELRLLNIPILTYHWIAIMICYKSKLTVPEYLSWDQKHATQVTKRSWKLFWANFRFVQPLNP